MGPIESKPTPAELRAAARAARRSSPAPESAPSPRRRPPSGGHLRLLRIAVALALLGAVALIAAEFLPLLELRTRTTVVATVKVGAHHSWAGLVLGVGAIALTLAFARAAAWPPAVAVALLGVAALLVALIGDVPDTRATGQVGSHFADAHARALAGAYVESLAGVLVALGGALGALAARSGSGSASAP